MTLKQHNAILAAHLLKTKHHVLSDEQLKDIEDSTDSELLVGEIMRNGAPFNPKEVKYLAKHAGKMDDDHDFERDGHVWRDDVLNNYASHIKNYAYKYKPEAQDVDPSIDPNEDHIGPMAQDIEKVNPAAVKADPKTGYKTVDTGRLALMNAGAIAELAREVAELKNA
jgi:hypothetical protein